MSKFIDDADDMVWQQVTPASADEVELLELARILYHRDQPEAERLALMAAEGIRTRPEVLRAYREAVARLPVIH